MQAKYNKSGNMGKDNKVSIQCVEVNVVIILKMVCIVL